VIRGPVIPTFTDLVEQFPDGVLFPLQTQHFSIEFVSRIPGLLRNQSICGEHGELTAIGCYCKDGWSMLPRIQHMQKANPNNIPRSTLQAVGGWVFEHLPLCVVPEQQHKVSLGNPLLGRWPEPPQTHSAPVENWLVPLLVVACVMTCIGLAFLHKQRRRV
jgi:hypothetical protein